MKTFPIVTAHSPVFLRNFTINLIFIFLRGKYENIPVRTFANCKMFRGQYA